MKCPLFLVMANRSLQSDVYVMIGSAALELSPVVFIYLTIFNKSELSPVSR